jgi:hypothetical protein
MRRFLKELDWPWLFQIAAGLILGVVLAIPFLLLWLVWLVIS